MLDRRDFTIRGTTADVIAYALMDEVSVLVAMKPGEPRAEVLSIQREEPPAARADRQAADEYRPRLWDELERIVGYCITDENFERALMQAQRPAIQTVYAEHLAARQRRDPKVLIRPGIGQVLGVR